MLDVRSIRWKRLDIAIKNMIEVRKGDYFDKETEKIKLMGRNNSWYSLLSKIVDEDAPRLWSIADMEPNKPPKEPAEDLASHFTDITNKASAL